MNTRRMSSPPKLSSSVKNIRRLERSRSRARSVRTMQTSTKNLSRIHSTEVKRRRSKWKWWHGIFFFSGASLLICLLQIFLSPPFGLRMTSSEVAATGIAPEGCDDGMEMCICPRETICATDMRSMILLTLARCSAFFDYPLYMMMFLSKAHNLNNIMRRTVMREWIDFADMHHVHFIFGVVIGVETLYHSFFHLLRWSINNDIHLLWNTSTGITGAVASICTMLIAWPMVIPKLKAYMSFEVRKGLHYLSWVWVIALMWHAPSRIFYLIGTPSLIYFLDYFCGFFIRNHLIENVIFERYGEHGVALNFENPPGVDGSKTSYVYIMCPWVSKWQWHAFSMFPDPTNKNHTMLCIGTSGDWTKEVYDKITAPCRRSIYVIGPYSSEFSDKAVTTTNALAIASGNGISPTLSLVVSYAGKKRINIIWMCRDPGLVEYFLHKFDIQSITKSSFAIIFYTGKRDLVLPHDLPTNFFIFRSRPKLEETISGIVTAIQSGEGLPEENYEYQEAIAKIPFEKRIKIALSRVATLYSNEEMFAYAAEATNDTNFDDAELATPQDDGLFLDRSSESELAPLTEGIEDMEDVVSVRGLDAMLSKFHGGIGEYSRADIEDLFKSVDTDNSGHIDRNEFDQFMVLAAGEKHSDVLLNDMKRISSYHEIGKLGSTHHSIMLNHGSMIGDESTIQYMESLVSEVDRPLDDWSMFYCGASTPVANELKGIERKYHIGLGIEKFDW